MEVKAWACESPHENGASGKGESKSKERKGEKQKKSGENKTHESRYTRLLTALHQLLIPLEVRRNENDLSTETLIRVLDELQHVRSSASLFGVPEA